MVHRSAQCCTKGLRRPCAIVIWGGSQRRQRSSSAATWSGHPRARDARSLQHRLQNWRLSLFFNFSAVRPMSEVVRTPTLRVIVQDFVCLARWEEALAVRSASSMMVHRKRCGNVSTAVGYDDCFDLHQPTHQNMSRHILLLHAKCRRRAVQPTRARAQKAPRIGTAEDLVMSTSEPHALYYPVSA